MSAQVYDIAFSLGGSVNSSMRNAFNTANNSLGDMNNRSKLLGKGMKVLGGTAIAAGAAIAGMATGIGLAVKASDEFNTAMKHLQASTGMSAEKMAQMKEISKNLYNENLGEDWNDLAEAVSKAQSVTKLAGKALEKATSDAIVYRDVWGEDISQSIKASDTMMRNFGISSREAYNLLAQGAQKGLNKSDELIDSANEYAPYFKTLGFSGNQMFDVFSAGLENGAFNLDKVGDAVKEFGIRSKDGSKNSMAAYKALGLSGEQMSLTFAKGGPAAQKAFNQVTNAIGKVKNPVDQTAIAVSLFGTQAEDLEMNVITSLGNVRSQFDMTKDTMEEVKKIKYDTLGMAFQGIGRQINTGLLIPIGEKLLPYMTKFSKSFKEKMPMIKNLVSGTMEKISSVMTTVGTGFDKLVSLIPLNELTSAFKYVTGGFNGVRAVMERHGESLEENLGSKTMGIVSVFQKAQSIFKSFKSNLGQIGQNVAPVFQSMAANVLPIVNMIGTGVLSVWNQIMKFWDVNGSKLVSGISGVIKVFGAIFGGLVGVIKNLLVVISPILKNIVNFVTETFGQIATFWNENGAQITQAVQNVFSGINAVIKFLAPVILFILNTVWGNVKGVIQGALSIIMGVVKVFAGLFTGDFGKMWEGVKQLFVGAIQFVWNLVNLLFIGKVLGGIKTLAMGVTGSIRGMWTKVGEFFQGGGQAVWSHVVSMGTKVGNGFSIVKSKVVSIVQSMWTAIRSRYENIVTGATSLPGKMAAGIKAMGGLALKGITTLGNKMLSNLGKVVNGVIRGVNWVMSKVGIDTAINEWAVPQYAKGTSGHPGGPAILGDGGGPELFRTPRGQLGLSPGKDTMMNLPRGTQVIPARETSMILNNMGIPAYGLGTGVGNALKTGFDWVKDKGSSVASGVVDGAKKIKDLSLDVFSYISDPAKLLSKVLAKTGIELPAMAGAFGNMAKGSYTMVKDGALGFLKDKLAGMGNFSGGAAAPDQVKNWVAQALNLTGTPMSWMSAMLVKAQKESGYNPRAINLWDSNAKKGIPSKGLFQTIDPTFNAYKMAGMDDIYNPIHNAVAAIRYIKSRYGTVFNTPGIKSMANGGGYKGYYKGGKVPNSQWAWVGERGPELMKVPGGTNVFSNEKSKGMMSSLLSYSKGPETTASESTVQEPKYEINITPQFNITGNADESMITSLLSEFSGEIESMVMQALTKIANQKKRTSFSV